MSDPVTNAEVEDVLSSIRRLVSEEKRPTAAPKAVQPSDRLVLTPALRIEEDAPAEQADASAEAQQEEQDKAENFQESAEESEAYSDIGTPDDQGGAVASQETGSDHQAEDDYANDPYNFDDESDLDGELDAALVLTPELASNTEWAKDALAELEAENPEPDVGDNPAPETKAATLSAKIEALETAIGGIQDEFEPDFEPDEVGTSAYSGTQDQAMEWEDDLPDSQLEAESLAPEPLVLETVAPTPEPSSAEVLTPDQLVADAPEPEQAEFEQPEPDFEELTAEQSASASLPTGDEPEQDAFDAQIAQETVTQLERPLEEAVMAAATAAVEDDDQPFAFASDAPLIDEEALRDMVGEIVRAELQGALGERITRNVRKLVRREIHRALTTQDLE